jgi:hypothetical protein
VSVPKWATGSPAGWIGNAPPSPALQRSKVSAVRSAPALVDGQTLTHSWRRPVPPGEHSAKCARRASVVGEIAWGRDRRAIILADGPRAKLSRHHAAAAVCWGRTCLTAGPGSGDVGRLCHHHDHYHGCITAVVAGDGHHSMDHIRGQAVDASIVSPPACTFTASAAARQTLRTLHPSSRKRNMTRLAINLAPTLPCPHVHLPSGLVHISSGLHNVQLAGGTLVSSQCVQRKHRGYGLVLFFC